jgi:Tfp pilus assembly PilM family ATPase
MKGTERYLAFIIERSHITAVEIAHSPKGKTLTAAGSFDSEIDFDSPEVFSEVGMGTREKTFAREILAFTKRIASGAHFFSFGLNTKMAMLQQIPVEASLTDEEFDLHLHWELQNYFPDANPEQYIIQPYALVGDDGLPGSNAMIISIKKSFVNFLKNVCQELHGSMHILDLDQFCAESAVMYNYPHLSTKRTVVIGMDEETLDASLLVNGKNSDIRTISWSGRDLSVIDKYAREQKADVIYLHGRIVTPKLAEKLIEISSIEVELADPFKKIALPTSIKNVEEIKMRRQEYTAAIGLAVRDEE